MTLPGNASRIAGSNVRWMSCCSGIEGAQANLGFAASLSEMLIEATFDYCIVLVVGLASFDNHGSVSVLFFKGMVY